MDPVILPVRPIAPDLFAPFGDIVRTEGAEVRQINEGTTERFHDLAGIDVAERGGRPIVSIFRGQPFALPIRIAMMERHPLGSQLFFPLSPRLYLAVVARDDGGKPSTPEVFLCPPGIGVNYARNTWHHPLLALDEPSDFLVIDRDGPGSNLQEHRYRGAGYRIDGIAAAQAELWTQ